MTNPNLGATHWSEAQMDELKAHYDIGMSAGEIARRIHRSRNSVIGKLQRLGLVGRQPTIQIPNPGNANNFGPRISKPLPKPVIPSEAPESRGLGMMALSDSVCRYPINDGVPEYLFCGSATLKTSVYCSFHDARCRVKATGKYK